MESGALTKAFALLEVLADLGGEAPLRRLAVTIHLPPPTVHRLLRSLSSLGYVEHQPGGIYRLTPKLKWLGIEANQRPLVSLADPILRKLQTCTGETVNLGVLRHDRICYLTVLESVHPLRRIARIQDSDPVFCTALGRAIAANMPVVRTEQLLENMVPNQRTGRTTVEPKSLRRILTIARAKGFAVERDETDLGVTCIAAPVMAGAMNPIAAISLSAPTARVTATIEATWVEQVCAASKKLSREVTERQAV